MYAAALSLGLAAGAAHAQPMEALAQLKARTEQRLIKYKPDGHYHTAGLVMSYTDVSDADRDYLVIFTQAPDDLWLRYSAPTVAVWGFGQLRYRHGIVNALHSLHGGDEQAVFVRRHRLVAMLREFDLSTPQGQADRWKMGLLMHALGDAYAHVYDRGHGQHAYNELYGHITAPLHGENPDKIDGSNAFTFGNYKAYMHALYCALDRRTGDSTLRRAVFDAYVAGLQASPIPSGFNARLTPDERETAAALLSPGLVNDYLKTVSARLDAPATAAEANPDACAAAR